MDEVKVLLPGDEYHSIGTQNLNGCTGLVVLGRGPKRGIVMGHFAPTAIPEQGGSSSGESARESKTRGITRGNKHFMDQFRKVALKVSQHPEHFEMSISCCILASFENEIPLGDLEKLAGDALSSLKIPLKTYTYNVLMPGALRKPGKGTVVAVRNDSQNSELWVEDKRKWPERDDTGALAMLFGELGLGGVRAVSESDDEEDDADEGSDDDEEDDADEGGDGDEEKAGDRGTRTTGATAGGSTRPPTQWSFNSPSLGGKCTYDESTDMIITSNGQWFKRPSKISLDEMKKTRIDSTTPAGSSAQRTSGATAGGSTPPSTLWSFNSPTLGGNCVYDESTDTIRRPNGEQLKRPKNILLSAVKQKQI
jgi:hypothetical protein